MEACVRPNRSGAAAEIRLPAEVSWEMLDKTKFFVLGAALFSGVNGMLYPSIVLKTQQQVAAGGDLSSVRLAAGILRRQGILGFYRGFSASLLGTIPARALYMSTLEISKSAAGSLLGSSPLAQALANAAAGMNAAAAAQLVWTPVDVISQRLMVQGAEGVIRHRTSYKGAMDAMASIVRSNGISGLYRGFGMSILTYAPSNAVWWGSYAIAQRLLWKSAGISVDDRDGCELQSGTVLGLQAASAACAGGVSALLTAPLDTIKTRIQVIEEQGCKPGFASTLRRLVAEEGWKGCYKGLGPRWLSMTLSATAMITTYELLKRLSTKE